VNSAPDQADVHGHQYRGTLGMTVALPLPNRESAFR
jgi:hypothetical protein